MTTVKNSAAVISLPGLLCAHQEKGAWCGTRAQVIKSQVSGLSLNISG